MIQPMTNKERQAARISDHKRGYAKGYATSARQWPLFIPPVPPDPIIGELVKALQDLRDTADSICAMFDEDDQVFIKFDKPINNATKALSKLSEWVRRGETNGD